jgi:hypothetical protein
MTITFLKHGNQACTLTKCDRSDYQFQFHKRSQLFISFHNKTLFVAAMRVGNEDCSARPGASTFFRLEFLINPNNILG